MKVTGFIKWSLFKALRSKLFSVKALSAQLRKLTELTKWLITIIIVTLVIAKINETIGTQGLKLYSPPHLFTTYLEVEIQTILKNESFWEAFVFFHVVSQSKVTIRGIFLGQEDGIVEAEIEVKLLTKFVNKADWILLSLSLDLSW